MKEIPELVTVVKQFAEPLIIFITRGIDPAVGWHEQNEHLSVTNSVSSLLTSLYNDYHGSGAVTCYSLQTMPFHDMWVVALMNAGWLRSALLFLFRHDILCVTVAVIMRLGCANVIMWSNSVEMTREVGVLHYRLHISGNFENEKVRKVIEITKAGDVSKRNFFTFFKELPLGGLFQLSRKRFIL